MNFLTIRVLDAFRQGLREAGYLEGETISIEYRWAKGDYNRLPSLASDLLARKVLVLVAASGLPNSPYS